VGLFERTKHLDQLARQIADENLRRLGAPAAVDDAATRRQLLELEAILREYRLNLQETDGRRQQANVRVEAKRALAATWRANAQLARDKSRAELADQALARAQVYERESDAASADAEQHATAIARLEAEIAQVSRRVASLRAVRRGGAPQAPQTQVPAGPPTRQLQRRPPRDPLEEEIEKLRS